LQGVNLRGKHGMVHAYAMGEGNQRGVGGAGEPVAESAAIPFQGGGFNLGKDKILHATFYNKARIAYQIEPEQIVIGSIPFSNRKVTSGLSDILGGLEGYS
jgi:hypothetical protein